MDGVQKMNKWSSKMEETKVFVHQCLEESKIVRVGKERGREREVQPVEDMRINVLANLVVRYFSDLIAKRG